MFRVTAHILEHYAPPVSTDASAMDTDTDDSAMDTDIDDSIINDAQRAKRVRIVGTTALMLLVLGTSVVSMRKASERFHYERLRDGSISQKSLQALGDPRTRDDATFYKWAYYEGNKKCTAKNQIFDIPNCFRAARELHVGATWGTNPHILFSEEAPPGCWLKDGKVGINANMNAASNPDYRVLCLEAKPPPSAYFEQPKENCPAGQEIHSPMNCVRAAKKLDLKFSDTTPKCGVGFRKEVCPLTREFGHTPQGCWTRTAANKCWSDGSCRLHLNPSTTAKNNGNYRALCMNAAEPEAVQSTYFYVHGKNCPQGTVINSLDACETAAKATWINVNWSGGTSKKSKVTLKSAPSGCFVANSHLAPKRRATCWSKGTCDLSMNTAAGENDGKHTAICMHSTTTYFAINKGDCPAGQQIKDLDDCLSAAKALNLWNKWAGGSKEKASVSHTYTPAGCWTRTEANSCWETKSCGLVMNTNAAGKNNGNYRAICRRN